jgi:hypothetical protein
MIPLVTRERRAVGEIAAGGALLLIFAVYFAWDIVTLRKALHHADIFTYYYPFRQWFAQQIRDLHLPIWNPYWGIGHGVEVWASIPLDLYTPLEVFVGPYYHWYQAGQLVALLGALLYVLVRFGAPPLVAAAGAILFFMSPMVTYWYFSFLIVHVYIAHALLFLFVWEWSHSGRSRYMFLIALATAASMLGTKVEFWFYQTVFFAFVALLVPLLDGKRAWPAARRAGLALLAMSVGILANAWQVNILVRLIHESGRLSEQGPANLFGLRMYRHLLISVLDSPLWQLAAVAAFIWVAVAGRPRWRLPAVASLLVLGYALWHVGALTLGYATLRDMPNASLERWVERQGKGIVPAGFTFNPAGPGCVVERVVTPDEVHDGKAAARLAPPASGNCFLRVELDEIQQLRGRRIRLAVWIRSDNRVADAMQVDLQDGHGVPTLASIPTSGGWQRVQLERQVARDAPFVLATVNVTDRASAPATIDEIRVDVVRGRPAWSRREYGMSEILTAFVSGPVVIGALIGMLLTLVLLREVDSREQLRTAVLFVPFIYYWCRPAPGEHDETWIIGLAPPAFAAMLAAVTWLGCRLVGRQRLTTVAYISGLFVLVMREQGQILLAWLAGVLWLPSRDNYIIDFAVALIGVLGLTAVAIAAGHRRGPVLSRGLGLVVVAVIVASAAGNLYYSQPLMRPAPVGYPFYRGVSALGQLFGELRTSPTTRVYLANYDARGFTYGFGEALLAGVGQVTMYSSVTSQRYKDWTIFHQLGIRPEQHWGGYPGGYHPAVMARLPHKEALGHTNEIYYHYTIIARPPLKADLLQLIGVGHVIKLHPVVSTEVVAPVALMQVDREIAALKPVRIRPLRGVVEPGLEADPAVAELPRAAPRAWIVRDVTPDAMAEFQRELAPRLTEDALLTRSHRFPIAGATLTRYEPERVTVSVETDREVVLVLGDLFHPFWTASLDGTPTQIFPALHLFRGVRVPAGHHEVEFHCRVPGQTIAVALSFLAAIGLATLGLLRFHD